MLKQYVNGAIAERDGRKLLVPGYDTVFCTLFTDAPGVTDFRSMAAADANRMIAFGGALAYYGVRVTTRGIRFMSMVHADVEIEATLAAADKALAR